VKILDRYIRHTVFRALLLVCLVLLPLLAFVMLADEIGDLGKGHYTLGDVFAVVGLSLPRYAYLVFPIIALMGGLLGLGGLAAHSELTALRAAGVSAGRITWAVVKVGIWLSLIGALVGEGLAPPAAQAARELKAQALSERITLKSRYGFWARDGDSFINIREILPQGHLRHLFIYEYDGQGHLRLSTYARRAHYEGKAWALEDISQSEISDAGVKVRHLDRGEWHSLLDPGMLTLLIIDPHVLPVWGLYRYIAFMEENGLDARAYRMALWGKLAAPLDLLAMLVLAVPLVFVSVRGASLGQRVFWGVLVGVGFFILERALAQISLVYGLHPAVAALLPPVIALVAAWGLHFQAWRPLRRAVPLPDGSATAGRAR